MTALAPSPLPDGHAPPIPAVSTEPSGAPAFRDQPTRRQLPDGHRWLFQHGPIDLILQAWGEPAALDHAYDAAWTCFQTILPALCADLHNLRAPITAGDPGLSAQPSHPVAQRMRIAGQRHASRFFVTPMAAVAGAVADHVLNRMTACAALDRAYVNNGGDIAVHLAPGQSLMGGIVGDDRLPALAAFSTLHADHPARGLATSGWRGRSHSMGIADAVTVLAKDAAAADVAATLIANAVTCDAPNIQRAPAATLHPDSDLGDRLVTIDVGALSPSAIDEALTQGLRVATQMQMAGLIDGALLLLAGENRSTLAPANHQIACTMVPPTIDPQKGLCV